MLLPPTPPLGSSVRLYNHKATATIFVKGRLLLISRPISMKKDGIQTRNRKISTKNKNKKRGPPEGPFYDMLKPQPNPYGDMKFHLPSAHAYIPAATQTPYPAQFIFHAS
ncbi:unnamed protein product [Acanthocheilonema viteae]|uniref:Uncharacterized protein n=1 Tax=Acanthocheilonema viteae TaxID=6277 RepID=A0A498SBE3_ACAVI|nr:unnamed protein product [Acanthocheilonema viteae]